MSTITRPCISFPLVVIACLVSFGCAHGPKVSEPAVSSDTHMATAEPAPFAMLPRALVSFGAAVAGDSLYVIGGSIGKTHQYSTESVSRAFYRLDLRDPTTWDEPAEGVGRQSVALVAHGGKVYRIGGMEPRNLPGEPAQTPSVAEVAAFDPSSGSWTQLPPLPEPRSSHDAAVLDGKIYVIGGWNLRVDGDTSWHSTVHVMDLTLAEPRWRPLPSAPFQRRALAVAAAAGKVFAIGGMAPDGISRKVDVFDTVTETWSKAPDLPTGGFAVSAFGIGDNVYCNGQDGIVYRLSTATGAKWETAGRLDRPRFFHRLVGTPQGELLAIGGAGDGGRLRDIERFVVDGAGGARTFDFTDPKNSSGVSFLLDSALEPIVGVASGISGTVTFDPQAPEQTTGRISVDVMSMNVANEMMKKLMLGHWLDPTEFPTVDLVFKRVAAVKTDGDNGFELTVVGDFTCHGVTKEITVPIQVAFLPGRLADRVKGKEGDLLVLRSTFSILRSDYDIYPGTALDTVADEVQLHVTIVGACPRSAKTEG